MNDLNYQIMLIISVRTNTEVIFMKQNIQRFITSALLITIVIIIFSPINKAEELYDNVIRLHVIANSDTTEDQETKLAVRDALLESSGNAFMNCTNIEDAVKAYEKNYNLLEETVIDTLESRGEADMSAKIVLEKEYYSTREYENFALPCGEYLSLKVELGAAEGRNWWCVLFPPLCLESAEPEQEFAAVGVNHEMAKTIKAENRYTYKFKVVEFFGAAKNYFKNLG